MRIPTTSSRRRAANLRYPEAKQTVNPRGSFDDGRRDDTQRAADPCPVTVITLS
ncbi:TPA: hypothetical protein HA344_06015 [Candidatus Bathyarchaeota archaeon]|nr:hypothetical protein [Candidatus Bathyarchaeota archaeon]